MTTTSSTSGMFISFDGGEGSGKSTQIKKLHLWLEEKLGKEVICTREPGGTQLGDEIRSLLIDPKFKNYSPKAEALLYAASRAQHVHELIAPCLKRGTWVISDRFIDASLAYQGVGRNLGVHPIAKLNHWATDDLLPDLSVILDIDPKIGISRAKTRQGGQLDRLEQEKIEFHQKIRHYYKSRAEKDPEHYLLINAELDENEIHELIKKKVESWIKAD